MRLFTRSPARLPAVLLLPLLLGGCLTQQLDRQTLSVTATVAHLETQQVIDNLVRFIDDPDALPAQTVLSGGTVQVSSNDSLGLSYPLDLATKVARTLTSNNTLQWTENWNLVPVTDGGDVRRLRALYRFAVYGNHSNGSPSAERPGPYNFDHDYASDRASDQTDVLPHAFTGQTQTGNHIVHTGWLYWSDESLEPGVPTAPAKPDPAGLHRIGQSGNHILFSSNRAFWGDFVLAVLEATARTQAAAQRSAIGPVTNP